MNTIGAVGSQPINTAQDIAPQQKVTENTAKAKDESNKAQQEEMANFVSKLGTILLMGEAFNVLKPTELAQEQKMLQLEEDNKNSY